MGEETVDGLEAKYVSGLSTIMVATIQEAKDRISQIEYIFCSQLYPNFQSKSRTFEKVYSEARLKACDAWKEREKTLLSEIEELKLENQRVRPENLAEEIKLENERVKSENLALIKDKEKLSEEVDKLVSMPFRLKSLEDYIVKLKLKSKKRSDQVQICIQLHSGLVEVLRVKGSDELNKDEVNMLLSEVKSLKVKAEELSKKTLVTENLLKKLEYLSTEAAESERKLSSLEEEKQRLTTRLQVFEENVDRLQKLLMQKDALLKEGKMALDLSRCKLYATNMEMLGCKKNIVAHEKEKLGFMGEEHRSYLADLEAIRRQSEEKSSELAIEVIKRKDAHSAYKKLKSQYNFLCKKFGLTTDSVPLQSELEDDTNQTGQHERPAISNSLERKHSETANGSDKAKIGTGSSINCEKERIIKTLQTPTTSISLIAVEKKHKETVRTGTGSSGSCEKESIIKTVQTPTTSVSPILRSPGVRNGPCSAKSPQLSGSKRPASIWRDTRSRQSPGGHDPHDDFLDTPIENVKRVAGEEKQVHDAAKKDDSDDETQDLNPKPSPLRQRIQVAETSMKGFKHVEPVRKKAERENLKGIECKQCKKFYDAVLPENEGNGKSLRCEHHEGVSRHRYKYAPPMTPEGFWNIGFESEM